MPDPLCVGTFHSWTCGRILLAVHGFRGGHLYREAILWAFLPCTFGMFDKRERVDSQVISFSVRRGP